MRVRVPPFAPKTDKGILEKNGSQRGNHRNPGTARVDVAAGERNRQAGGRAAEEARAQRAHARLPARQGAAEAGHADLRAAGALRGPRRGGAENLHRRSEEHTSELQSRLHLVCRLLLEKKKKKT